MTRGLPPGLQKAQDTADFWRTKYAEEQKLRSEAELANEKAVTEAAHKAKAEGKAEGRFEAAKKYNIWKDGFLAGRHSVGTTNTAKGLTDSPKAATELMTSLEDQKEGSQASLHSIETKNAPKLPLDSPKEPAEIMTLVEDQGASKTAGDNVKKQVEDPAGIGRRKGRSSSNIPLKEHQYWARAFAGIGRDDQPQDPDDRQPTQAPEAKVGTVPDDSEGGKTSEAMRGRNGNRASKDPVQSGRGCRQLGNQVNARGDGRFSRSFNTGARPRNDSQFTRSFGTETRAWIDGAETRVYGTRTRALDDGSVTRSSHHYPHQEYVPSLQSSLCV